MFDASLGSCRPLLLLLTSLLTVWQPVALASHFPGHHEDTPPSRSSPDSPPGQPSVPHRFDPGIEHQPPNDPDPRGHVPPPVVDPNMAINPEYPPQSRSSERPESPPPGRD